MIELGINIDHVATLRNARGTVYPSLATAAGIAEQNGADFITIHLREDRRHINEEDLDILSRTVTTFLNLEMACNKDVLSHALKTRPAKVTLVPERREEITTEGGLDIIQQHDRISEYVTALKEAGIIVSLFIEPDPTLVDTVIDLGVPEIEIHTGSYADTKGAEQLNHYNRISDFARLCKQSDVRVCAGHGLTYHNTAPVCRIPEIEELNIGHAIISQAMFCGLGSAVRQMKNILIESVKR